MGLRYYAKKEDTTLSDILRHASINTENQFMVLSYYSWKYYPDTGRSTGEYIVFYQGGPIDPYTHVSGPVSQSSAESKYNTVCTVGMNLSQFSMLNNELFNKDPDVVPEQAPIVIFDSKSAVCMNKNGKDTKHTIHITRRM